MMHRRRDSDGCSKMTDILFILDELHPVRNAPSVRIENLRAALPAHSTLAIGGAAEGSDSASMGSTTIPRPSERSPFLFLLFIIKLAFQAVLVARRARPRIIILSVPKYELLLFAPALARRCSHLIIDIRDSLGFLDYRAYLAHFLPTFIATPLGALIKRIVTTIQQRALRTASVVTVANRGIAGTITHPNVHLISNGVDTDIFTPASRSMRDLSRSVKLVYVGNFAEKDRFDLILDPTITEGLSLEVHLIGDGRNRNRIIDQLTAASIPFQYHGLIPHHELPALLSRMDIGFIFRATGVDESIPVALFEFASCGIPSVCNGTGIMASFVREHNLGYVISTADELKAALTDWLAEQNKATRSNQLHLTAVREFSLKSTRSAFQKLASSLLANSPTIGNNGKEECHTEGVLK